MALGNSNTANKKCVCGNSLSLTACCLPLIAGKRIASSPEQLMRSRYSAYVLHEFKYIHRTYSRTHSAIPSVEDIADSANDTQWLKLNVLDTQIMSPQGQVEFRVIYKVQGVAYQLHERSDFFFEENQWGYSGGEILADSGEITQPLNGPCLCGSGKKLKRCCLRT
ncbi:YchJ family metal-binding protein [Alteromonadaceae bacterium BrNp21-10]|nr:YchJ family metal-binding protein [Alteromonadaceae bacterium BrNp21-10]